MFGWAVSILGSLFGALAVVSLVEATAEDAGGIDQAMAAMAVAYCTWLALYLYLLGAYRGAAGL